MELLEYLYTVSLSLPRDLRARVMCAMGVLVCDSVKLGNYNSICLPVSYHGPIGRPLQAEMNKRMLASCRLPVIVSSEGEEGRK